VSSQWLGLLNCSFLEIHKESTRSTSSTDPLIHRVHRTRFVS
jgi:hypothetical protein